MSESGSFIAFAFGLLIGAFVVGACVNSYKDFTWRHAAVERGYAKWTVDEWGKAEFQWIEREEQP